MTRPYNRKDQHQPMRAAVHADPHAAPIEGRLRRKNFNSATAFDIDPSLIPDGMDLNWKCEDVMGQSQDRRMQMYRENHWEEVDASKVPGVMPSGFTGVARQQGMVLMQRPKYLSDEANAEAHYEAVNQVTSQLANSAVQGEGEGPRTRPELTRTMEVDG